MRICYFDAFSGISGDMSVGALVDAGADWTHLSSSLASLALPASFRIEKVKRHGIAATKFHVEVETEKKHRHLPEVEKIIGAADLTPRSRSNALRVFQALAEAEARSHNVTLEKVHFHEVGAADSISDIVGACVALDLLDIDQVACSDINTGSGTVETQHGTLPVPAPATAHLLAGKRIYAAGPGSELTTPTGAALAVTLANEFGPPPAMTLRAQGFGAGSKDFADRANVLRVLIGETMQKPEATEIQVIEATLDDTTPQLLGYAMERLLNEGALDVNFTAVTMKKSRPGTVVTVLASPDKTNALSQILFSETTTLGVRIYNAQRQVLPRDIKRIETAYGSVAVKVAGSGAFAPEYDDCRRIALERGLPLREVMDEVSRAYRQTNGA